MEGITDIRIIGLDERRPPRIRKEPYVDICFKLSHKAPADWCRDFNGLLLKHPTSPKIKESEGLYIEAWVRQPDQIAPLLTLLKTKVKECNQQYIERIEERGRVTDGENLALSQEEGKQGELNRIIESLDFEE